MAAGPAPGKRTLTELLPPASAPVQRKAEPNAPVPTSTMPSGPLPTIHDLFGRVQRKAAFAEPDAAAVHGSAPQGISGGQPLPEEVRVKMERAFHADFSAVRVHEGPQAPALGALAYTQGTDVHFAPGRYAPHDPRGQELLGHELAHTVQQADGRVTTTGQAKGQAINGDPALEREADEQGNRAAHGEPARPRAAHSPAHGASAGVVQRMAFDFRGVNYDTQHETGIRELCNDLFAKADRKGLELLRVILQKPRGQASPDDPEERSIANAIAQIEEALGKLGADAVSDRLFDPQQEAERGGDATFEDELRAFHEIIDDRPSHESSDSRALRFPPGFLTTPEAGGEAPSRTAPPPRRASPRAASPGDPSSSAPYPESGPSLPRGEVGMKALLNRLPTRYGTDEHVKRILQTGDSARTVRSAQPQGQRGSATVLEAQEAMVAVAYAGQQGIPAEEVERARDRRSDAVIKGRPFDVKSPRDKRLPDTLPPRPLVLETEGKNKPTKGKGTKSKEQRQEETRKIQEFNAAKRHDKQAMEAHRSYLTHHDASETAAVGPAPEHIATDVESINTKLRETENEVLLDYTYASENYRGALNEALATSQAAPARIHRVDLDLSKEYVREDQEARRQLAERYDTAMKSADDPALFQKLFWSVSEEGAALRKHVFAGQEEGAALRKHVFAGQEQPRSRSESGEKETANPYRMMDDSGNDESTTTTPEKSEDKEVEADEQLLVEYQAAVKRSRGKEKLNFEEWKEKRNKKAASAKTRLKPIDVNNEGQLKALWGGKARFDKWERAQAIRAMFTDEGVQCSDLSESTTSASSTPPVLFTVFDHTITGLEIHPGGGLHAAPYIRVSSYVGTYKVFNSALPEKYDAAGQMRVTNVDVKIPE